MATAKDSVWGAKKLVEAGRFETPLRSQLENYNVLTLIIFLIGEQSNPPAGGYAWLENLRAEKEFLGV